MDGRDRDESGKPRNSRPRDALGRPLPYGAQGVPRIPDDLSLDPTDSLAYAQSLLDRGLAFHAHEVLEAAWKNAPASERRLWQSLAQLAVGFTHVQRGNPAGAANLLRRAAERLAPYGAASPHGIDVDGLVRHAHTLLDELARGTAVDPERLRPKLRREIGDQQGP